MFNRNFNRKFFLGTILLLASTFIGYAQTHHDRFESLDVLHYSFEIHLNDSTNNIEGKTNVTIKFLQSQESFKLDLVGQKKTKPGMFVSSVVSEGKLLDFSHKNSKLEIIPNKPLTKNSTHEFEINYSGTPVDGLVISENKSGKRTFFGDNWPDRAKHWLPTIDHPSDKATLEFKVFAPEHYEVISNGYLVEKSALNNNIEFTHRKEDVPLSTKLMVIGVADFEIGNQTSFNSIPVDSWVFSENKRQALKNYEYGTKALEYFSDLIGPYSYEKLSHVQSKTRYGGMENASCIFYHEKTGIENSSQERLFAHEVAHQWFGNSVTEQNWHHVWLSEGFATYLTHVYNQNFYGDEKFNTGLKNDRDKVIRYSKQRLSAIIDTTVTEYIQLLNANSYQKASWFLHMLRAKLGDEIFFEGLKRYYAEYRNSAALTKDFLCVMERVSSQSLAKFFEQWLWYPGHPQLNIDWKQNENKLSLNIQQFQDDYLFQFPLKIKILFKDGTYALKTIKVSSKKEELFIPVSKEIKELLFDPEVKLLFEIL